MKFALLVAAVAADGSSALEAYAECLPGDMCAADTSCCDGTDANDAVGSWCLPVGSAEGAELLDDATSNVFYVGVGGCNAAAAGDNAKGLAVGAAAVVAALSAMA